jgi:hypothetical protein
MEQTVFFEARHDDGETRDVNMVEEAGSRR